MIQRIGDQRTGVLRRQDVNDVIRTTMLPHQFGILMAPTRAEGRNARHKPADRPVETGRDDKLRSSDDILATGTRKPRDRRQPIAEDGVELGYQPLIIWSFTIFHFRSAAPAVHCGRGASIPASGIILAQFNRAPIPFLQIVMRNQASGRGSSCSISSLKFALSRREQAAVFSHSPRHDVWLQTERLSRLQTFVPHSQDSRLPSPENA